MDLENMNNILQIKKLKVIFSFFIFFPVLCYSQDNLVLNGSFDKKVIHSEVLFYHTKNHEVQAGHNKVLANCFKINSPDWHASLVKPQDGNGMIGLVSSSKNKLFKEYIVLELVNELQKDKNYSISFDVMIDGRRSPYITNSIGYKVLDTIPYWAYSPLYDSNAVHSDKKLFINKWVRLDFKYKPRILGEKYLIIGVFLDDNEIAFRRNRKYKKKQRKGLGTYVLIDNVDIRNLSEPETKKGAVLSIRSSIIQIDSVTNKREVKSTPQSRTYLVNFKQNSYEIRDTSFLSIVNQLSASLKQRKTKFHVNIIGHTDNDGNIDANIFLSKKRAKSVKQLFLSNGISAEHITATGMGSERPIAPNNTKANKRKNRRVEIIIKGVEEFK